MCFLLFWVSSVVPRTANVAVSDTAEHVRWSEVLSHRIFNVSDTLFCVAQSHAVL